jgi:hypothetical protein
MTYAPDEFDENGFTSKVVLSTNSKFMNKTDIAFYLTMAGLVVREVLEGYNHMKAGEPTDWLVIGLGVASSLIYGFYDYLTSTKSVAV